MARSRTKITFDDLAAPNRGAAVPETYHGLHWENVAARNRFGGEAEYPWFGRGTHTGATYDVTSTIAALGAEETFTFKRMLAAASHPIDTTLTVRGFRDGVEVASWQGHFMDVETPLRFGAVFRQVDAVVFSATKPDPSGGPDQAAANMLIDSLVLTSNDIVWA